MSREAVTIGKLVARYQRTTEFDGSCSHSIGRIRSKPVKVLAISIEQYLIFHVFSLNLTHLNVLVILMFSSLKFNSKQRPLRCPPPPFIDNALISSNTAGDLAGLASVSLSYRFEFENSRLVTMIWGCLPARTGEREGRLRTARKRVMANVTWTAVPWYRRRSENTY